MDQIEQREAEGDEAAMLLTLANTARHFGLGETPRQTARRPWWDVLSMLIAMKAEEQQLPDGLRSQQGLGDG